MISVVCGIITKGNNIFICRRNEEKSLAGYWEFPGGKIKVGESEEEALKRELLEELGMDVKIGQHFITTVHKYPSTTIKLIAYRCQFKQATFSMTDHDLYQWVKVDDLIKWKLAPADLPIANQLIIENGKIQ